MLISDCVKVPPVPRQTEERRAAGRSRPPLGSSHCHMPPEHVHCHSLFTLFTFTDMEVDTKLVTCFHNPSGAQFAK